MPTLEVAGRSLFYLGGPGPSPAALPLVCLHGAGGSAAIWTQLHAGFASGRPVFALDLPGHGRSAPLVGAISLDRYAAVVRDVLDALGLARALLVGHSMGGAVALLVALAAPERVAGLLLVGTAARLRVAPAILEGIRRDPAAAVERICAMAYGPSAPSELVARGVVEMRKVPPAVLEGDFRACDGFDVRSRVGAVAAPALVVVGSEDAMTPPRFAAELASSIPGARLETVPGAGHMLPVEAGARLVTLARPFLASL
jgi:pimeloyl-ACP methyl ester carboxylesterase